MSDAATDRRVESDGYVVREYEPGDREGFLSLYASVWGHREEAAWFDWRFRDNPYGRGIKMVVVERSGEIVGAEPVLPFPVRGGGVEHLAYQPVDWIVHPDHRRRGLFTRMTERLLDSFSGERTFMFNFPTDVLLPGLAKFDWHEVGTVRNYYRVQRPSALAESAAKAGHASPLLARAATLLDPALALHRAVRDRVGSHAESVTVERHETVPAATLVDVHRTAPIDRIHVAREAAFYRWRFANPNWAVTTYVARSDGRPVASVVAAAEQVNGVTRTSLLDVQPMRQAPGVAAAFDALLGAVVSDHRDVDVLKTAETVLPRTVLRRWGFRAGDAFPLSKLAVPARLVARPLPDSEATAGLLGDRDLANPDDWLLALADQDVG